MKQIIFALIFYFLFPYSSFKIFAQILAVKETISTVANVLTIGKWINQFSNNENTKVYYIKIKSKGQNFDQAKDIAFKLAVQQALGTFILSETVIKLNEVIREDIIMYSGGYIQDFKILEEKRDNNLVTLTIDVWVSESKIANRVLNTNPIIGQIEGDRIATQLSTLQKDKKNLNELFHNVLQDYPTKSFELNLGNVNFQLSNNHAIVEVPVELIWSQKFLDAFGEVLTLTRDGTSIGLNNYNLSQSSTIIAMFRKSKNINASFHSPEPLYIIHNYFKNQSKIQIVFKDELNQRLFSGCMNIHFSSDPFYQLNTHNAHLEIRETTRLKKKFSILLTHNDIEKVRRISKVSASVIEENCV